MSSHPGPLAPRPSASALSPEFGWRLHVAIISLPLPAIIPPVPCDSAQQRSWHSADRYTCPTDTSQTSHAKIPHNTNRHRAGRPAPGALTSWAVGCGETQERMRSALAGHYPQSAAHPLPAAASSSSWLVLAHWQRDLIRQRVVIRVEVRESQRLGGDREAAVPPSFEVFIPARNAQEQEAGGRARARACGEWWWTGALVVCTCSAAFSSGLTQ